jgi:large subunit ribosomal protein L37Ae
MANKSIRYGVSLRKRERAVINQQKARYKCDTCGKLAVRRKGTGIWHCSYCNATYAGGAYTFHTAAGEVVTKLLGRQVE